MERIADKQKRHVTFSKRRNGLFKTAQELCSLTGATIAIVCFSEAGRPFTFCHPPSAKGDDGGDDHQRVLSIMQQYYESSRGCTITAAPFQSEPVGEPKSIDEYQNMATDLPQLASDDERTWASTEPLYASSIDASHGIVPISTWVGGNQQEMRLRPQLQRMHEKEAALLEPG
ncbi:Agamous-like MADS-box protein [Nymphaea thermarum]|nr:Agamous-like MADS-box protein [Nymphaea thermarum]